MKSCQVVIVRDGKLYAAGCLLPLSAKSDITKDLGTRHRAAIGLSEATDAVVVVVSEETGTISTAVEGNLQRGYTRETLTEFLRAYLTTDADRPMRKFGFIGHAKENRDAGAEKEKDEFRR